MTDTNMTDEWIAKVVRENPFKLRDNGNIVTCPVRLSFPNIFKRSKPIPPNTEGKFGANLIIPPVADIALLKQVAAEAARNTWPNAGQPNGPKLKTPLQPQAENQQYEGYGPQGYFLRCMADRRFPFVDQRMAPITEDAGKDYPGAWVIASIRPFTYDKQVNKGVSFGLQSLMFIADDKQLGGGGGNPSEDFAGVSITGAVNPAEAFGAEPQAAEASVDPFS